MITNRALLTSHGNIAGRNAVLDILEAGLKAPDPYDNMKKIVRLEKGKLIVGHPDFSQPLGQEPVVYDLKDVNNIYVVGGGKAAQREAWALEDILGDLITEGQINTKKGDPVLCKRINVTLAGHPIPDEDSVIGAQRILDIERKAKEGDIVFFCTSGGGTALKALPAPGITLEELQEVYRILYFGCGATMPESNAVRNLLVLVRGKHPKNVRGATLLQFTTTENPPVVGAHTFKSANYANAYDGAVAVLKHYDVWDKIPDSVRTFFTRRDPRYLPPTPEEIKQRP
ncbi:MAG: glycerate-2-kinase family protein, partial [Chloroflexota bacterium]